MKLKTKKYIYIVTYIVIMILLGIFNSPDYNTGVNIPFFNNPLLFLLVDYILIKVIMKLLTKEKYVLQERVVLYFLTINNLFVLGLFLTTSNFIVTLVNIITNLFLIFLFRPLTQNPKVINSIESYLSKYNRNFHRFYQDENEIKEEYQPLKEELDTEIPVLSVTSKDEKKNKKRKIIYYALPVFIVILLVVSLLYNFVEIMKTFERARYNYYDVYINGQLIEIKYEETFDRVIIPHLYRQHESNVYSTNEVYNPTKEIIYDNEYLINLIEYECYNDEKGNNVRTSCNGKSLQERKVPIKLVENNMIIYFNDEVVYDGKYKNNITSYLKEVGTYKFEITNKREHIKTKINFSIEIKNIQ